MQDKYKAAPKIVDKSLDEINQIIAAIESSNLSDTTKSFVINCIRTACWLPSILQKKNISISRLKSMVFGNGSKKRRKKKSHDPESNDGSPTPPAASDVEGGVPPASSAAPSSDSCKPKAKGHGRNSHDVYENFDTVMLSVTQLMAGMLCPNGCGGRMQHLPSGVVVRISGGNLAQVTKYYVEKLRCNVCHYYVTAKLPKSAGPNKYQPSFLANLALHKFYLATPYYRLAQYQKMLKCPLPESTQWDLIERLAGYCYAPFQSLQKLAAIGPLICNDDTHIKILEVIAELKKQKSDERRGMYTTCVIGQHEGHEIVLYLNGTMHSGENVNQLLKHRDKQLPLIAQMSDALSVNTPSDIATLACNCLSHGFRKFDELKDFFPKPCIAIMRELGRIFEHDKATKHMTDEERLIYHQEHSKPILFKLYQVIEDYLADSHVEPNGELAATLRYMQKHWVKLTRFLTIPGVPISNNIVERALKLAIRVRKNAYFYKTCYSASLSGMLTSLIRTCESAGTSPVDYLIALQVNAAQVTKAPEQWLPWNYSQALMSLDAMAPVAVHSLDRPALTVMPNEQAQAARS